MNARQKQFHVNDVEPAVEFVADFLEASDDLEAEFGVQTDAHFVFAIDHSNDRMKAEFARTIDKRPEEEFADALATMILRYVNGILGGETVALAVVVTI